jgi:hypothetical protein
MDRLPRLAFALATIAWAGYAVLSYVVGNVSNAVQASIGLIVGLSVAPIAKWWSHRRKRGDGKE